MQDSVDGSVMAPAASLPSARPLNTRSLVMRIQHVAAKLRVQLDIEHEAEELVDEQQATDFSLLFNDIGVTLAGGNAQAVTVAVATYTARTVYCTDLHCTSD